MLYFNIFDIFGFNTDRPEIFEYNFYIFYKYIIFLFGILGNSFGILYFDNYTSFVCSYCFLIFSIYVYSLIIYSQISLFENNIFLDFIIEITIYIPIFLINIFFINLHIGTIININIAIYCFMYLLIDYIKIYFEYELIFFNFDTIKWNHLINIISIITCIFTAVYNPFKNYNIEYNLIYFCVPFFSYFFSFLFFGICYTIFENCNFRWILQCFKGIRNIYYDLGCNYYNLSYNCCINNNIILFNSPINQDYISDLDIEKFKCTKLQKSIKCCLCNTMNKNIIKYNNTSNKCILCLDNNREIIFADCKHYLYCIQCLFALKN